ncbi:MAG: TonB family protein [Rhodospirillales bacterium]
MTLTDPRPSRDGRDRGWLELVVLASLLTHVLVLGIILFARRPPSVVAEVPNQQGFALVWDHGQRRPDAVPAPGRYVSMPKGEHAPNSTPAPQSPEQKPSQQAMVQPRPNPLPPETQRPTPETHAEKGEAAPAPAHPARREQHRQQTSRQVNPFAHPLNLSFASVSRPASHNGLRGSKSLDLSMGLMIEGGQLREAVPHVSSPGADGDYMELLTEYVETHKFYPERAAANREDGVAVIRATIERDGTVKDVHLVESSGSRELDLAWIGLFRNQRLAPFPEDMRENERDFTLSMDYVLIYR